MCVCVCVCVCVCIRIYMSTSIYRIYMSTSKVFSNFSNQLLPTALTHLICFKTHLFFLYFCSFFKKKNSNQLLPTALSRPTSTCMPPIPPSPTLTPILSNCPGLGVRV